MLANLFSSKILFKILEVLFVEPNKKFSTTEIITITNKKQANVSRELDKLVKWQMVLKIKDNGQNYYQVNQACAEFAALKVFFQNQKEKSLFLLYNEEDNGAFLPLQYVLWGFARDYSLKAGLIKQVPQSVSEFKNNYLKFYFEKSEMKQITEAALDKLLNQPEIVDKVIKKYNWQSGQRALEIFNDLVKKNFHISANEAILVNQTLGEIVAHQSSLGLLGILDLRTNVYSNYIKNYLDKKTRGTEIGVNLAMEKLLSPVFLSFTQKLRQEILTLVLENKFDSRTIEKLTKNWGWLNFGYRGPGLEAIFFELTFAELRSRKKSDLAHELLALKNYEKNIVQEKNKFYQKLKIDVKHQKFIEAISLLSYLKIYRKDVIFLNAYILFKLLEKFNKNLNKNNLYYLTFDEVNDLFRGRLRVSNTDLSLREKHCVYLAKENRLLAGVEAEKFMRELPVEKEQVVECGTIKQLDGNTACLGKTGDWVYGKVRIINTPDDMKKMEAGDILVSMATTPDILPAMKKAVAIVTDHGGITCHAAIVSRELNIPCLIGTRYATKVFKDGDQVVVCPRHGYIKFAA